MTEQNRPTNTVRSAFAALAKRDWGTVAGFVDSQALASLRQDALGMLILTTEQRLAGEKVGGGYNPNEVVVADHLPRVGSQQVKGFRNRPTIAKLASLSPREFFIEWAEAAYGPETKNGPVRDVVGLYRRIIGEVAENAETAYVVYRRESRYVDMGVLKIDLPGRAMIMPVVGSREGWRIEFNDDIGWSIDFSHVVFPERPYRSPNFELPPRVIPPEPPAPPHERIAASPTPVEIVDSVFAAFKRHDWKGLSALVHRAVLRSFQQKQLSFFAAWGQSKEARARAKSEGHAFVMYSFDDSMSPDALALVADIEIPVFSKHRRIGDLAALPPEEFFQEWCRAAYDARSHGVGAFKNTLERRTIGHVFEGDSLAHVLYRTPSLYRMPVQWSDAGWRIMLNDDIGWSADLGLDREEP